MSQDSTEPARRGTRGTRGSRGARDARGSRGVRGRSAGSGAAGERASAFDAFYKATRDRLLLQAFAVTGDLGAARRAVRDTYVVAWHHWSKVGSGDPEAWARPHAWTHAARRRSARPFHRERDLDEESRATLEALAGLSGEQRRVLVLNHLVAIGLSDLAREVGLTVEAAEATLQAATARFSTARGVASTSVRTHLDHLSRVTSTVRWPRHTIIRRAGTARRRGHTVAGTGVTVAALVLAGSAVTDLEGAHPTLTREAATSSAPGRGPGGGAPADLPPTALLPASALRGVVDAGRGTWVEQRTDDNAGGDGRALPCQGDRYADPEGAAMLVRTFRAGTGTGAARAYQLAEASTDEDAAARAYATATSWFAGCTDPRTQLLATYQVPGAGDDAHLFVLRDWRAPARTVSVGVARTGRVLTATATIERGAGAVTAASVKPAVRLLRAAVDPLCGLPGGGACTEAGAPARPADPLPVRPAPQLLGVVDLPPVRGVDAPWQGSEATRPTQNVAATRCDRTSFSGTVGGTRFTRTSTRTFLVPGATLPPEFGLTETAGLLDDAAARAFVAQVRDRLASCSKRQIGSEVTRVASSSTRDSDLAVWRVTSQISVSRSVRYAMAILRDGPRVAQVGFIAAPGADLANADIVALARRALARLGELPAG